uniref:Uncharacterized protein n=1 Tax=Anopheles quadriannulatus TaxID=34691 RepID=A0A182XTF4_ANOQN
MLYNGLCRSADDCRSSSIAVSPSENLTSPEWGTGNDDTNVTVTVQEKQKSEDGGGKIELLLGDGRTWPAATANH